MESPYPDCRIVCRRNLFQTSRNLVHQNGFPFLWFTKVINLNNIWSDAGMSDSWSGSNIHENLELEGDYHLSYFPPDELETLRDNQGLETRLLEFKPQGEYSYLKEQPMDIASMGLTDRQIVAVSLVFFGGVKKNLAARIMNISSQALRGHIKAGLKKMSKTF